MYVGGGQRGGNGEECTAVGFYDFALVYDMIIIIIIIIVVVIIIIIIVIIIIIIINLIIRYT